MSQEEINAIPPGWAETVLSAIVQPRSGKSDPQSSPDVRFIGMEQIQAHTMRLFGTIPASMMKSSANVFRDGDVLYGRLRAYLNKVYQPDFDGLCSGEFIVLPESTAVLGRFLKYRLNAGDFVQFATSLNTGDRPRVDFDQIGQFRIRLPTRREQEDIADALDELFSDLDDGVASLERARAKLNAYRASVLKAAVDGTLTAEWRAEHPDAEPASALLDRLAAERRRRWDEDQLAKYQVRGERPPKNWKVKYPAPGAPPEAELSPLPSGWNWVTLDMLIVGGPQNGLYLPNTSYGHGCPILRIDDFQDGWSRDRGLLQLVDADEEDVRGFGLRHNDLVINRVNSMTHLGKCLIVPSVLEGVLFESNMMRAELTSALEPKYIELYLQSLLGRRLLTKNAKWAVNQASINQQDVRRTPVALPPLAEQQAIIEIAEEQLFVIDHLESDIDAKVKSAQSLRQSILRHAFTGQLVPQDPNDEPASVLLERIAAERAARHRPARKQPRRRVKRTP